MLSNTGLFATQPLRFEEFEDDNDFLSYSDLLFSSASPFSEPSSQTGDHFLDSFISSKNFDSLDEWENTLLSLDTPSLYNEDLQSPFESPLMDWPSSPLSSCASHSPVIASLNHRSPSFNEDLSIDFKAESNQSNLEAPLHERRTPTSSLESKVSALSRDEIADLWIRAFPCKTSTDSQLRQQETASPAKTECRPSPSCRQKRKSATPIPTSEIDSPSPSKKRNSEQKVPRRAYQRKNSSNSSSSCKGSKLNHNLIEKRYRCSLNDKIALLRGALPNNYGNNCCSDDEDDMFVKKENFGTEGDMKQKTKGAVLSNAVRYIHSLEVKVNKLEERLVSDRASQ